MIRVFVSVRHMQDQFVSTIQLCAEIGVSRSTLDRLRNDGVLLPGVHWYRLHGRRSPMYWSTNTVIETLRSRTALVES